MPGILRFRTVNEDDEVVGYGAFFRSGRVVVEDADETCCRTYDNLDDAVDDLDGDIDWVDGIDDTAADGRVKPPDAQ